MDHDTTNDPMTAYVQQAWALDGQLPLLIGIAILLGMGKGGVPGFAMVATAATVATAPTSIPGGLGLAVAHQVPILTMIDISAAWIHAKDIVIESIKVLLPLSFVGMTLGQWLDGFLSDSHARLLVGILLLMILSMQLSEDALVSTVQKKPNKPHKEDLENDAEGGMLSSEPMLLMDPEKNNAGKLRAKNSGALTLRTKYIWAAVVGIAGGAAAMLTNTMGPILNIYLLSVILNVYLLSVIQLSPTAYIGTRAIFICFLNCVKLPMRFLAGTLGWRMLPLAGFLGIVSVLGVIAAKPIMLSISEPNFVKLELAVVTFSGMRLCWMGLFGK